MADSSADPDTTQLLAELTRTLRDLERDVEPERRLRPPTPGELTRFTSEVAIPGLILLLRTNIRALELLRRTLRLADGRRPAETEGRAVRDRAEQLGSASLSRLDDVLTELQSTLSAREGDQELQALLARARELQSELEDELSADGEAMAGGTAAGDPVGIDVEAELQSLKDDVEDDSDGEGGERG